MAENPEQEVYEPLYVASVPTGYAPLDPTKEGAWRILSEEGRPVALLWSDFEDGAGIAWVEQTDLVMQVRKLLSTMKLMGRPAGIAYAMADTIEGTDFGPDQYGILSDAKSAFSKIGESNPQESQNDATNNE
jgi:hypothetical protein